MSALRGVYRWLVSHLPPRAAWAVWRLGVAAAARRRGRVPGPAVVLAHVAWGSSEDDLTRLMDTLIARAGASPSEVLVVSDSDAVHAARAAGCRLEYVPGREGWLRAFPDSDYDRFLEARGRAIAEAYRIDRLEVPPGAPEALHRGLGTDDGGHIPA